MSPESVGDLRFQSGGALQPDAFNVPRKADGALLEALRAGRHCYLLAARQVGKTSLLVRVLDALPAETRRVRIDLSSLGTGTVTEEQWYFAIVDQLALSLDLDEPVPFWEREKELGPVQRLKKYLLTVVLADPRPFILAVDEIDVILLADFRRQDFFAFLRSTWTHRDDTEEGKRWRRFSFCLVGLGLPEDLMPDLGQSPFQHAERIELGDLSRAELEIFRPGLRGLRADADLLLDRVFHWTHGHPALTQKILAALLATVDEPDVSETVRVDRVVDGLFPREGRPTDLILADIDSRFDPAHKVPKKFRSPRLDQDNLSLRVLDEYLRLLRDPEVPFNGSPPHEALRVIGLARVEVIDGSRRIRPRNELFRATFDARWVDGFTSHERFHQRAVAWSRGEVPLLTDRELEFELGRTAGMELTRSERSLLEASRDARRRRDQRAAVIGIGIAVAFFALAVVAAGFGLQARNEGRKATANARRFDGVLSAVAALYQPDGTRELLAGVIQSASSRSEIATVRDTALASLAAAKAMSLSAEVRDGVPTSWQEPAGRGALGTRIEDFVVAPNDGWVAVLERGSESDAGVANADVHDADVPDAAFDGGGAVGQTPQRARWTLRTATLSWNDTSVPMARWSSIPREIVSRADRAPHLSVCGPDYLIVADDDGNATLVRATNPKSASLLGDIADSRVVCSRDGSAALILSAGGALSRATLSGSVPFAALRVVLPTSGSPIVDANFVGGASDELLVVQRAGLWRVRDGRAEEIHVPPPPACTDCGNLSAHLVGDKLTLLSRTSQGELSVAVGVVANGVFAPHERWRLQEESVPGGYSYSVSSAGEAVTLNVARTNQRSHWRRSFTLLPGGGIDADREASPTARITEGPQGSTVDESALGRALIVDARGGLRWASPLAGGLVALSADRRTIFTLGADEGGSIALRASRIDSWSSTRRAQNITETDWVWLDDADRLRRSSLSAAEAPWREFIAQSRCGGDGCGDTVNELQHPGEGTPLALRRVARRGLFSRIVDERVVSGVSESQIARSSSGEMLWAFGTSPAWSVLAAQRPEGVRVGELDIRDALGPIVPRWRPDAPPSELVDIVMLGDDIAVLLTHGHTALLRRHHDEIQWRPLPASVGRVRGVSRGLLGSRVLIDNEQAEIFAFDPVSNEAAALPRTGVGAASVNISLRDVGSFNRGRLVVASSTTDGQQTANSVPYRLILWRQRDSAWEEVTQAHGGLAAWSTSFCGDLGLAVRARFGAYVCDDARFGQSSWIATYGNEYVSLRFSSDTHSLLARSPTFTTCTSRSCGTFARVWSDSAVMVQHAAGPRRGRSAVLTAHGSSVVTAVALDGLGASVAVASSDARARVYDAATQRVRHEISLEGPATALALSHDGNTLWMSVAMSVERGVVHRCDLRGATANCRVIAGVSAPIRQLEVLAGGTAVLAAPFQGPPWWIRGDDVVRLPFSNGADGRAVDLSSDASGAAAVALLDDGAVEVWRLGNSTPSAPTRLRVSSAALARFDLRGEQLAVAAADGTVTLYAGTTSGAWERAATYPRPGPTVSRAVRDLIFARDGRRLLIVWEGLAMWRPTTEVGLLCEVCRGLSSVWTPPPLYVQSYCQRIEPQCAAYAPDDAAPH